MRFEVPKNAQIHVMVCLLGYETLKLIPVDGYRRYGRKYYLYLHCNGKGSSPYNSPWRPRDGAEV